MIERTKEMIKKDVDRFVTIMYTKLEEKYFKEFWDEIPILELLDFLEGEIMELKVEIYRYMKAKNNCSPITNQILLAREAADVANYAMMIACNVLRNITELIYGDCITNEHNYTESDNGIKKESIIPTGATNPTSKNH